MNKEKFTLNLGGDLKLEELDLFSKIIAYKEDVDFDIIFVPQALRRIQESSNYIASQSQKTERAIYGVNTGYGILAEKSIPINDIFELQHNLIKSHCCGVGELLDRDIVAMMWLIRLNTFSLGYSGIRKSTIDKIISLLKNRVLACVPSRGSVGASGDLAQSAHASLILLGEGKCTILESKKVKTISAAKALKISGINKMKLYPKEGLALINGTQLTTSLAVKAYLESQFLYKLANLAAAFSFYTLRGSTILLRSDVLKTHKHTGTLHAGEEIAKWLDCKNIGYIKGIRVQDSYCLRCAPQVHGMVCDTLEYCSKILSCEINASQDNPQIFYEQNEIISCGNFHAIYPAKISDILVSSLTTLASISERRINKFMSSSRSSLPDFLIENSGLNSGMMMWQVTAAALVSECKSLSYPASVDSISTNCDQEDHVSMGPIAGFKALKIIGLVKKVLAIELLVACQAVGFVGVEKMPQKIFSIYELVRKEIPFIEKDRVLSHDFEKMMRLINKNTLFD